MVDKKNKYITEEDLDKDKFFVCLSFMGRKLYIPYTVHFDKKYLFEELSKIITNEGQKFIIFEPGGEFLHKIPQNIKEEEFEKKDLSYEKNLVEREDVKVIEIYDDGELIKVNFGSKGKNVYYEKIYFSRR